MKIVKLKGGLGNQMFQYTFAKLLEKESKETVKLDFSSYCNLKDDVIRVPRIKKFNLSLDSATDDNIKSLCILPHQTNSQTFLYKLGIFIEQMINRKYFWESNRAYIEIEKLVDYKYFDGYWQSWRYLLPIIKDLKKDFTPKEPLDPQTLKIQQIIQSQNAVFVGIRKGDYTANKKAIAHYGSFSLEYYITAMRLLTTKVENPIFYIFSNDIPWCKSNMNFEGFKVIYRDPKEQVDDFEELMLMSSCKHAIIANSTYHWWGAVLIENDNKNVISPNRWFFDEKPIDIIPNDWKILQMR